MFRIESYITSIILSYVDRYIKNFRQQDAQVSLWEGDGLFQNLNLDLEVLEQELNLPFSFVSGHIHELLIHVPWTRLTSEPVQITINTIECVMKLKPPGSHHTSAKPSKKSPQALEDPQSQSSLMSSLVNKIICNLSITCNNLILKYVEEDIVLSMNIKTLSFGTVNNNWERAFMELSVNQLELRKLITLSDVTVCLDKRNASGRIESYLEPLLYRCSVTIRLCQSYSSISAKRASSTRLDIFCERMAFTVSEPQIPMLMRLMALSLALHRKELSQTSIVLPADDPTIEKIEEPVDAGDPGNPEESWSSWSTWALSWMPTLIPLPEEDGDDSYQETNVFNNNIFNFGLYVDTFTLALKLCESDGSGGVKTKCQAFLHILLNGCRMDLLSYNSNWTNVQMGICQAAIKPDGDCCCGVSEPTQLVYLSSGVMNDGFLSGSLFDKSPSRIQDQIQHSWKFHLESVSETIMLEKSPAFAVDYLSCVQDKMVEEEESDDEDNERLPAKEKVIIRYVAGPLVIRVCSGLIHRIQMMMKACSSYDYVPYNTNSAPLVQADNQVLDLVHRLSEKSIELDEDLYSRYLPIHTSQFTAFNTVIEFYPANHLPIHFSNLGRKLSRTQRRALSCGSVPSSPPPCVTLEWKCIYATLTRPLNPDKILLMASKFQREKLPVEIMNTSLTRLAFKAVGVSSSVRLPFLQAMKVVEMSSISSEQTWHSLIAPLEDSTCSDVGVHIENITITSSKAKLILLYEILSSLIASNNRQRYLAAHKTIYNTSLLHDAASTTGETIYLKLNMEQLKMRRVSTGLSESTSLSVMACQLFLMRLQDKGDELEAMIMAAPDSETPSNVPLLEVLYQQPSTVNVFPPLLTFKLREILFSADPLFYTWLTYTPTASVTSHSANFITHKSTDSLKSRKVSESSLSSYLRRAPTPQESIHSSSERETTPSGHPSSQPIIESAPVAPFTDRVASLYSMWKTMIVYGDVSQVLIYFPQTSLVSPHSHTMNERLQVALRQFKPPLQVAVIKLPTITLRCANYKQGVEQFTSRLPVKLPSNLWSKDKDNFPWTITITDLHCYTLHGATCLPLLKPVSFNCTIGMSPKFTDHKVMTSLALCVHLDTTPVSIKISEEQVVLVVNLLMAQLEVLHVLSPTRPSESPVDPACIKLISSEDSSVSQSDDIGRSGGPLKVKLTGWLQWTLVRTTVCVYSKPSINSSDELKLVFDIEDIILSLDVERVYHKVKFKVATASICHYVRSLPGEQWKRGAFQGLVMRGYDPDAFTIKHSADESQGPAGFLMATVTRAKCTNFHSRLGSPSKTSTTKKSLKSDKFITEIEVKMQPLDFVLSPTTLGMFLQVLDPLLGLAQKSPSHVGQKHATTYHTGVLPLLYLDIMTIRVVLPTSRQHLGPNHPDVLIIQFDGMSANPHPENPICRTPLRPDIYHKGEKQRILNIPGSELEDRQYQFNLSNLRVQTGLWQELEEIFVREVTVSSQHQNPALDWNEGRSPMFQVPAHQLMHPLISSFDLSVVIAPAMFYMDKDIVCGHAAEINAVSDIIVSITLDQLFLCGALGCEIRSVLQVSSQRRAPKTNNTATVAAHVLYQSLPHLHVEQDSGIESTESTSSHVKQADPNIPAVHAVSQSGHSQISGIIHSSLPSSVYPTPLVWPSKRSVVPSEILITGSALVFSMYAVETQDQPLFEPLLHIQISQPHTFICRNSDNLPTCQVSAFDLGVSLGIIGHSVSKQVANKPFPQPLLETRNGDPHPLTGIPPSLFTAKMCWNTDKSPEINVDFGRPTRLICKLEIIDYLKRLQAMVNSSFFVPLNRYKISNVEEIHIPKKEISLPEVNEHHLRKLLRRFSKIFFSSQQLMLVVSSHAKNGAELCLSVGKCSGQVISNLSLQQAVTSTITLASVTVSAYKVFSSRLRLLLNPWHLTIHTNLSWDSWVSTADPPGIRVSVDSDILSLQFSPEQVSCLNTILQDYSPYLLSSEKSSKKPVLSRENSNGDSSSDEQQYHDDLQAGAFQFVDASSSRDDLPLTYQVVFGMAQMNNPTMAWRYPQPRAITKFFLLPIPFRGFLSEELSVEIEPTGCLQYYSEGEASYQDYAVFNLSESESQLVELPQSPPRIVATTWRVVLNADAALVVPVKALAASIRVDSFFSPSLIPSAQVDVSLTAVKITLWTHIESYLPLPEPLDRYYLDRRFPEEHDFCTAVLEQSNVSYSVWPKVSQQVTVKGRARLDVLNYFTLSNQCCVLPVPVVISGYSTADSRQWGVLTGHVNVRLGPALSHSLASSLHSWAHYNKLPAQVLLTPYVICNNTCLPIRFRQAGSDEYIPLQCFQCHMYSWRTTKHPMELEFGILESEDQNWSKGMSLKTGGNTVIRLSTEAQEYALIISVRQLNATVCQVTVNGQLALHNNLSVPVEVRIMQEQSDRPQSSLLVQSGSSPPTVVIDPRYTLSLKLRFSALSALWSGEIPLKPTGNQNKQWEVKLPLKDRGQFRSIWCHVVFNVVDNIHQVLVVVSPLYNIQSLLPCQANVLVETPALSSSQVVPVSGRGTVQHLDTPGLSDETHNITFQWDEKVPASRPPVSLNYHVMDGSSAPDPTETDINTLLVRLQEHPTPSDWPYLGNEWAMVDWISTTQPDTITHVKVRFSGHCVASNTLLIEVKPWALLINTLGSHIYLQGREMTLCSLAHRAIISPPPLESTFQIGVELDNSVELSSPIQLKKGPGFEIPHIPGLLPPTGFINCTITGKDTVCFMNITSSELSSLQLLHVRASYVVASLSKRDLFISPVAVKSTDSQHTLSDDVLKQALNVRSQTKPAKLKYQPLTEWTVLGAGEGELLPYLVIGVGEVKSCPVQLPNDPERHCLPVMFPASQEDSVQELLVMTTQQIEGQTCVLLWDQPCPQITLHNNTNSTILFAKAKTDGHGERFEVDCKHIRWQLKMEPGEIAHYNFPSKTVSVRDTDLNHSLPAATIAVLSQGSKEQKWSDPINLTQCTGRLLTLLGLPDLTLSVSRRGFTTHITLSQASHIEILAVDIRGQLSRQLLSERRLSNISNTSDEKIPDLVMDQGTSVPPSFPPSEVGAGETRGFEVSCYVHGLTTTLLSQSDQGCECKEIAALTLDCIGITVHPHPHQDICVREMKIHITVGDLQLDNQEFSSGGYDFPVVLLMQKPLEPKPLDFVVSQSARRFIEKTRTKGSAADLTIVMDVNSHTFFAMQDVSVKLQPLQMYIEDKYILHLKDSFMNLLPTSLLGETSSKSTATRPTHSTSQKTDSDQKNQTKNSQIPDEIEALHSLSDGVIPKEELSEGAEEEDLFNVSEPDLDGQVLDETRTSNIEVVGSKLKTSVYEPETNWTTSNSPVLQEEIQETIFESDGFPVPNDVLSASRDLARPLRLRSLSISELDLLVSIHTSTKFYIALDHSPLQLAAFKRSSLYTTAYRLGHSLTVHYFFGAIYGTGWALGSLELLGAPGGLARSLRLGLWDFISLPSQGILVGPRAFFIGIAHGSASLMQHIAAGTITSVTRLAASWARTLDRLTLDSRDLERSEELRRLKPQNLTQGVVQGLTEFGISLIGAISSLAHHPLQYVMSEEPNRSLVNSIGLGLVGVFTRPLSGMAELVALTGEGLLSGVGWTNTPRVRHEPVIQHNQCGSDCRLKYKWKLLFPTEQLLIICEATTDYFEAVTLLVTNNAIYVVNSELDIIVRAVKLTELCVVTTATSDDPTLVAFKIQPAKEQAQLLSQSRILDYVRESQRVLVGELSHISPPSTPVLELDEPQFQFFINPQVRNHFLAVLEFAVSHAVGRGFPVIS